MSLFDIFKCLRNIVLTFQPLSPTNLLQVDRFKGGGNSNTPPSPSLKLISVSSLNILACAVEASSSQIHKENMKVTANEKVEISCLLIRAILAAVCHQLIILCSLLQVHAFHMFEDQKMTKCRLANSVVAQCKIFVADVVSQQIPFRHKRKQELSFVVVSRSITSCRTSDPVHHSVALRITW